VQTTVFRDGVHKSRSHPVHDVQEVSGLKIHECIHRGQAQDQAGQVHQLFDLLGAGHVESVDFVFLGHAEHVAI
jgi:hypothetical protein